MSNETWAEVGIVQDIPKSGARVIKTENGNIGIFRTADDQIFAIEDLCPHLGGVLTAGIVHGAQVTCPLHNWVIDLQSGSVLGPDEGSVHTIPVRVEDNKIFIQLEAIDAMKNKELV